MKAMLLAAGLGTRLRPVTETIPKPAVPFLNIPLLYYPLALLEPAGIDDLVVNAHYHPNTIEALARTAPGYSGRTRISLESGAPLGSGGGISHARRWLEDCDSFFVANGDEVIIPSSPNVIPRMIEAHRVSNAFATILVMKHPEVGSKFGGVWTDGRGFVHGFGKQRPEGSHGLLPYHYIGVLLLSSSIFRYLPSGESNLLYDGLVAAIRDGHDVRIFEDACGWFETGNIPDFVEATGLCLAKLEASGGEPFLEAAARRFWPSYEKRESLWRGLGSNPKIEGTGRCLLGDNVHADDKVQIDKFCVIGNDVRIGSNCRFEECVVLSGAHVPSGSELRRTIVRP